MVPRAWQGRYRVPSPSAAFRVGAGDGHRGAELPRSPARSLVSSAGPAPGRSEGVRACSARLGLEGVRCSGSLGGPAGLPHQAPSLGPGPERGPGFAHRLTLPPPPPGGSSLPGTLLATPLQSPLGGWGALGQQSLSSSSESHLQPCSRA